MISSKTDISYNRVPSWIKFLEHFLDFFYLSSRKRVFRPFCPYILSTFVLLFALPSWVSRAVAVAPASVVRPFFGVVAVLTRKIRFLCRGHISCDALRDELATSFAYICIHPAAAYQPHCDGTAVALGNLGIAGRHRRF